jgi:predicted RecB family nuclease
MQNNSNNTLFSATDLNAFIECKHKVLLNFKNLKTPLQKKEDDAHTLLLQKKGHEHEAQYIQSLKESGCNIVEIPSQNTLEKRAETTLDAMKSGADYIYQAALLEEPWHGFADLLERVNQSSLLGPYCYEAVDIKLKRTPEPSHIIQLCVYSDLLKQYQGITPISFSLVLGNGEKKTFQFSDFAQYYITIKRQFEAYASFPTENSITSPSTFCSRCKWQNLCDEQWKKEDHLSQVANIQKSQIIKLENNNIQTLESLALLNSAASIPKLPEQTLNRLKSQARLQYNKRKTGNNELELLPPTEGRGFARLPKPDPADLFFDMEGDPLYAPDGLEYLLGFYYFDNGNPIFKAFWAHDKVEEKRTFQLVIDFITTHLKLHPNAHIYHYNHYEETAIKRLASSLGTRENDVDNILRGRKLVDLFKVVRDAIRTSEPGYSIKNLETFYMKKREGSVATAMESIVVYEHWKDTKNDELLKQISDYNEDDCRSTYLLQQWLLKLRPTDTKWFELANEENSEEKKQVQTDAERKKELYEIDLLKETTEQDRPFRELVSQLLEFHRREEKPEWWSLFDRQENEIDELKDDLECLANLTPSLEKEPFKEKKSTVYSYCFPPQEHKLKLEDNWSLTNELKRLGTIHSLDNDEGIIGLKTTQDSLPESCSITLYPSHNTKSLKEALYRFADSIIAEKNRYPAIIAFLKREKPQIKNQRPNTPIIDNNKSIIEASINAVENLQNSYLFIQGPPGAGKTYTSSQIIVSLINSGKRVGVSSNSHKAINNLLTSIEKDAKGKDLHFRGQKKSNKGDSEFKGEMIQDIFSNKDLDTTSDLIAGTAWLFSREELDQKLDYLFIDEAGQVSLANFVAMGMSAKNIILMGDQMQLSQPIKGTHPSFSGMSTLEYLLQDKPIISSDRGIFLATTWRMHENICRFISDAVYDSKLHPEKDNQKQSLILSEIAHPSLLQNGIQFISAQHKDCSQKSEEEGKIIKELYFSLMQQSYCDRQGNVKRITSENILIVAPYNMQVNYLKSILPEDAKVGTVDKFQGQEAEIVIVSMTTSSGEDLPRNLEFLYSKNRLNVAISRARTLAVVIASPQLLEIPCNTIEQMCLVNTLCWVKEYSGKTKFSE